tara:strand:- start:341 stop:952 length:612 start_codon:yes stop_codon:yes gene_type:complete
MSISHEDFQKARRISRVIQEYMVKLNLNGLRSTDIYPILAQKGLVERDRHQGLFFRRFLKKLLRCDMLKLIPQCKHKPTSSEDFTHWYFYQANSENLKVNETVPKNELVDNKFPEISEKEIDELIVLAKPHVNKLPVRECEFSDQQLELRKMYARACEEWSDREKDIMYRAYNKFLRIDKVAELLDRQPHIVKRYIDSYLNFN